MVEILFVHGALVRDGAWWWRAVGDIVRARMGVTSRAVALPSCGEGGGSAAASGLREDADALQRELDTADDVVVVGHSYGGMVIAEGAEHPAVRHLVYITSYLPDVGRSQSGVVSDEADPVRVTISEGVVHVDGYTEAAFADRFWHDVDARSTRDGAWRRTTGQGAAAFTTPTTRAAWLGRASTYLVCADDRSTSLALQREHADRATHAVELPAGHHPFLSRPDLVAEQLQRVIRSL
ncbi:alpha/beta hydrolase [Pseudolysinimonas kribbensis]|uniref:alpha/beta hydrolase n=1 Tax=Pseudolysinimonas kribbensis TaxID=433641 RepID=UPI0031D39D8C